MLFGDRHKLAIEVHPLAPSWERAYLPEQTAWSTLSIWVGGENLCRNLVEGTDIVREGINVPLASLADWFVRSWSFLRFEERPSIFPPRFSGMQTLHGWGQSSPPREVGEDEWIDSREAWWSHHFLAAGSDGAQLPNLCFVRSAESMAVEWARPRFAGARAPRFLTEEGQSIVPWDVAESTFSEFVAAVADWLRREELGELYPWVEKADPLRELETDFKNAVSVYTGRSYEFLLSLTSAASEEELREKLGLPDDAFDPGGSVVAQILRDLPVELSSELGTEILHIDEMTHGDTGIDPTSRAAARDAANAAETPEESGYLAADEIRRRLNLDGQPIPDLDGLARNLGILVRDSGIVCRGERMLAGARRGGAAVTVINSTPRTQVAWGRRFELARGLGHLLIGSFRDGALGVASSAYSQPWMRRCSGAFAAELLLPTSGVDERGFGDLDSASEEDAFQALMEDFGVGARTAAYQLWNHGLLSSTQIRDDLIDKFAHAG